MGGCEGDGALAESGGLGLPNIADRIEYSKFAASEPKVKSGSKVRLNRGSVAAGNGSANTVSMTQRTGRKRAFTWRYRDRDGLLLFLRRRLSFLELLCARDEK